MRRKRMLSEDNLGTEGGSETETIWQSVSWPTNHIDLKSGTATESVPDRGFF